MKIYGVLDSNNCHTDVSLSERGAKRYATLHGYTEVSYRVEYYAVPHAKKVNGRWQPAKTYNKLATN